MLLCCYSDSAGACGVPAQALQWSGPDPFLPSRRSSSRAAMERYLDHGMLEEELLKREIEIDPLRPGPANVRLRRSGVHVWALIGHYLNAAEGDKEALARDYDLFPDEVEAALL